MESTRPRPQQVGAESFNSTTARLQIAAAALLFSSGGVAIKSCSLPSWQVAGFRSGIAVLVLLAALPGGRRIPPVRSVLVGVGYAATMIAFVLSNKLTTAANAIYLQSTFPLYILLLGPWLLHERLRPRDLVFSAALAVGLALFFVGSEPPRASATDPVRGNILAIISGVFWAFTIVGLRWLGRRTGGSATDTSSAVVVGNAIAFLVCLPIAWPLQSGTLTDWGVLVFLGVFQIGAAYVCLTSGIQHVPAFEAGLLLLLEPVFNPLWAWLVHGEEPGFWSLLGGATVLGATVIKSWWDYRTARLETANIERLAASG